MLQVVIGAVVSLAKDWFIHKRERSQAKHEAKIAHIANRATWEQTAQANAGGSWKDEYWTIILSLPCMAAFVPWLVPYVKEGFSVLNEMPMYYKAFVGASIGASFGYKKLVDWRQRK